MRMALALGLLTGLMTAALANDAPSADEINRLVLLLGDNDFAKQRQAKKQLQAIGKPALPILTKAAESNSDPEIRSAAKALITAIEGTSSGFRAFSGHRNRVNGVAISADGKRGLSASWDGTVRYWNFENGELIAEMRAEQVMFNSVALSPDGKRALTGANGRTMYLWDLESAKEIRKFEENNGSVWDIAFSPDGKKALCGCGDGSSRLWDLESGSLLQTLVTIKDGCAWSVAYSGDGKQAVTGGGNALGRRNPIESSLKLWDLTTGKLIRQFEGHTKDIRRVAISPDGKQLLSGSFDGTMRLWDLQTGKEIRRFKGPGNFVEAVAFTPDGKRAICCYGSSSADTIYEDDPSCSLQLWDLGTGKELHRFKGHKAPILSLALSGDGRFVVSGSADLTMRLWEVPK